MKRFLLKLALNFAAIAVIILFSAQNSQSQETSPTLSFGLNEVLFGKGVIDVELLTRIIEEKQDELKKRIIEKQVLEPVFKETSFATKNYIFTVVHELLNEKDKNVIKKQLMEHTVNYAVIYSIAEMYVQLSIQDIKSGTFLGLPSESLFQKESIDKMNEISYPSYLYKSNVIIVNSALKSDTNKSVQLNGFVMDCILQAILENKTFQDKGFLKTHFYFDLDQYKSMSFYQDLKTTYIKDTLYNNIKAFVDDIASLYESFETLEKIFIEDNGSTANNFSSFENRLMSKIEVAKKKVNEFRSLEIQLEEESYQLKNNDLLLKEQVKNNYAKSIGYLNAKYSTENYPEGFASYSDIKTRIKKKNEEIIKELRDTIKSIDLIMLKHQKTFNYQTYNNFDELKKTTGFNENQSTFYKYYSLRSDTIFIHATLDNLNQNYETWQQLQSSNTSKDELKRLKENIEKAKKGLEDALNVENYSVDAIIMLLENQLTTINKTRIIENRKDLDSIITQLYKSFYFVKYNQKSATNLEYVTWMRSKLLPQLQFLNLETKGKLDNICVIVELLAYKLEYDIYAPILSKFHLKRQNPELIRGVMSDQFYDIFKNTSVSVIQFIKFFQNLDQLDGADTYYYLLRELKDAGEQSDNRDIANAISLITQSIEKYTSFNENIDHIELDVESIILALVERYGDRDKNPLNFHLTLGLNNAFSFNSDALVNGAGNSVRNLGYASEKIGVRLNLYNWKLRSSYLEGETKPYSTKTINSKRASFQAQPLVSNLHVLVFGSGLLYQLTDLGTTKDLNATFIGTGFGITFYNNMNFNVCAMVPVKFTGCTKIQHTLLNVGFDIYFTEYISALNKKRKENKEQKMQAEVLKYTAINQSTVTPSKR